MKDHTFWPIYRKITRKPNRMPSIKDSLSNYHTNNEKKAFFITDSIYDLTYNSTVMIAD